MMQSRKAEDMKIIRKQSWFLYQYIDITNAYKVKFEFIYHTENEDRNKGVCYKIFTRQNETTIKTYK